MTTAVCRILIQAGHALPELGFTVQDGYMIIHVPEGTPIVDTHELCNYTACRKPTTIGIHMQRVRYCDEHAAYSRSMQKKNYANGQRKVDAGFCVRHGCRNPRAQNKRQSGLGRCCVEHAVLANKKAKLAYRNNKSEEKG